MQERGSAGQTGAIPLHPHSDAGSPLHGAELASLTLTQDESASFTFSRSMALGLSILDIIR